MGKLHLKRTPAEEAQRAWRKTQRAARKAARRADAGENASKRRKTTVDELDSEDDDLQYGPQPAAASSSTSPYSRDSRYDNGCDSDEARFRAKLADALEDDGVHDATQRLDSVEAHFGGYTHIPRRWRGVGGDVFLPRVYDDDGLEEPGLEPWQMNDDEYAEWMRAAMWRRKHPEQEAAKRAAREAEKARKERAAELKRETARQQSEMARERALRKAQRRARKVAEARKAYEDKWLDLSLPSGQKNGNGKETEHLDFESVPWPIFLPDRQVVITEEDISRDTISAFLLPRPPQSRSILDSLLDPLLDKQGQDPPPETVSRDTLRAALLRYHPDKFNSRVLPRVRENERDRVRELAGTVVRVLNEMLSDITGKK
ncbi:hypothetical protein BD410DRAFT_787833 [Rickenella mellea]|uniref:Uncharacterized protein n=1 Tax=Rickenella mellea TaxID=50990 RepID=A0A4Y7Q5T5_9AGAM|nr:hypothetical protein BD410DRAFT_787833 [Rickenella mellea]